MTNLPEGWAIKADGENLDGQCRVEIIGPSGKSAAFFAGAGLIVGRVLAELAEAQATQPSGTAGPSART